MGKQFLELTDQHIEFIEQQKLFFVGTATAHSKVNVSPKGMDSLRVLDRHTVAWLNVTGSGNETAAHVQIQPRMTIMFAAFAGSPMILRLYGTAKVVHRNDADWQKYYALFQPNVGARQVFVVTLELVQTSCGMAVPFYEYVGEREQLNQWATQKGDAGLSVYWQHKNQTSLDGLPTHIVAKNTDN